MYIEVDKEAGQAIMDLLDIALKVGGLKNLDQVNKITNSITVKEVEDNGEEHS